MAVGTFVQPDNTTQGGTAYKNNIDNSVAAMSRVGDAFAAHEQAVPDMTVRVDAGGVLYGATLATATFTEVAAQTSAVIVAPAANPRIDRVVTSMAAGVVAVVTGVEAAVPAAPAIPTGYLPNCQVLLQTTSTEITNSMITDERSASVVILDSTTPATLIKARAYCGSTQALTESAYNTLHLNTVDYDASSIVDIVNYRIIPNMAGYYQVNAQCGFQTLGGNGSQEFRLVVRKNGTVKCAARIGAYMYVNHTSELTVPDLIYMNGTTDYLDLAMWWYGAGTASNTIGPSSEVNYLSVVGPF